MVLVDGVMAMHHVFAGKVAKANEDSYFLAWANGDDVLASTLMGRRRYPIARQYLELFHMDVNWVPPVTAYLEHPDFGRSPLDDGGRIIHIKYLAVDGPAA